MWVWPIHPTTVHLTTPHFLVVCLVKKVSLGIFRPLSFDFISNSNREVLQTEFRKLRRKRAAAGCESRKIMAHLSENPSECSVRPASNRTKFSVRFCGLRQCHVHFSIVIGPSTVTQCDASRQTQAKLAAAGLLSEIQWCRLV